MTNFHTIVRKASHASAAAAAATAAARDVQNAVERAPEVLADTFVPLADNLVKRRLNNTANMSFVEIINADNTSSITLLAIFIILGGFITVFLLCVLISRILAVTNKPRAEAFPYYNAGKGMYQPSANMGYGVANGGPTKAAGAAGLGSSPSSGLLASAAPMGGRDFAGSTDSLVSRSTGAYGQAPTAMAGRSSLQHTRGASSGLGFPGPPTAARRGPGAAAQQHPPLQSQQGPSNYANGAPDGSGFQPSQGAAPRLRNPLANGPPPASDARRQSRYNRAGGGLNGGLGANGLSRKPSGAQLRDPRSLTSGSIENRKSRIQSVGAGVYRKSMYMGGDDAAAGGEGGLRRVESVSRGNSLRYRDPATVARLQAQRQSQGLSVAGNTKSWARYSQMNPMPNGPSGRTLSVYGGHGGSDAERKAFEKAQKEGFGAGPGFFTIISGGDPLRSSQAAMSNRYPANAPGGPPHLTINTIGPNGSSSNGSSPARSSPGGMEYMNSPAMSPGYVVPSPTAPNYAAFQEKNQAALRSSAYNAAPQQYAGLRPGMPVRSLTGGSVGSSGSGSTGGGYGGMAPSSSNSGTSMGYPLAAGGGADLDMFASAPLPRGASSYAQPPQASSGSQQSSYRPYGDAGIVAGQ